MENLNDLPVEELKELASSLQLEMKNKNTRLRAIEIVLRDHQHLGQFTTFGRASSEDEVAHPLQIHLVFECMAFLRSESTRIALKLLHPYQGNSSFSDEEECTEKPHRLCPEIEKSQIQAAVRGVDADSYRENLLAAVITLLVKKLVFDTRHTADNLLAEFQHCVFRRGP